ncbi:F-box only protein 6-like [Antedon mediterranea]|uniref:F-box only protein 6-like n=1 Tax=Antedon mediterranea TaxID=105859 RepID=UPI003AF46B03
MNSPQKPVLGLGLKEIVIEKTEINNLPDEMLSFILSLIPDKYLKNCILVCHRWLNIVSSATFWKEKCFKDCPILSEVTASYLPIDHVSWRTLYYLKPYSRNLIHNPSGADGLKHKWKINSNGGNGVRVEKTSVGAKDKPDELLKVVNDCTANFATSYGWGEMEQIIDLEEEGCSPKLIDELQPEIYVSEWYTERFDCGCYYELKVQLLGEFEKEPIKEYLFKSDLIPQWSDNEWKQANYTFKNYGNGVRFIRFVHRGKDSQFWAGHYGSKMAAAEVRILVNKSSNVPD